MTWPPWLWYPSASKLCRGQLVYRVPSTCVRSWEEMSYRVQIAQRLSRLQTALNSYSYSYIVILTPIYSLEINSQKLIIILTVTHIQIYMQTYAKTHWYSLSYSHLLSLGFTVKLILTLIFVYLLILKLEYTFRFVLTNILTIILSFAFTSKVLTTLMDLRTFILLLMVSFELTFTLTHTHIPSHTQLTFILSHKHSFRFIFLLISPRRLAYTHHSHLQLTKEDNSRGFLLPPLRNAFWATQ